MVQLSYLCMTVGKTIALTSWTFVGKVMSLFFSMLSRLLIAFLSRSKHLLVSWLQPPSTVIFKPKKIKSVIVSPLKETQTHVHQVGDAIQPSHSLSSPSPPAFNLSQHQGLSQ